MKRLVIFGAGDIAALAHFYFSTDSDYEVAAFTVDRDYCTSDSFLDLPLEPFESVQDCFPPGEFSMFVAVSYKGVNKLRAEKVAQAREKGYRLASYISSRATMLAQHPPGENCFLLEDNTVQPFVRIGSNVTLWSGNHIGHHSEIADHCFISSHVVISGGVKVGERAFIGVNSTLRDHITIGARAVIGAGCLVLADVPEEGVLIGSATTLSPVPSSRLKRI